MGMAATSAGNGIGNRGLVEGFIRARIAAAVLGNQYGGVIGIQPFVILRAILIISTICARSGLGIGQLDCVGKLYWRKIGDRDVDIPYKSLVARTVSSLSIIVEYERCLRLICRHNTVRCKQVARRFMLIKALSLSGYRICCFANL